MHLVASQYPFFTMCIDAGLAESTIHERTNLLRYLHSNNLHDKGAGGLAKIGPHKNVYCDGT